MIDATPTKAATACNAQVKCDCGNITFEVGAAVTASGNNFIRILQCTLCRHQMVVVHESDAGLQPMIRGKS